MKKTLPKIRVKVARENCASATFPTKPIAIREVGAPVPELRDYDL
jgi:hypothetical protein